jgi:hypothetical protein
MDCVRGLNDWVTPQLTSPPAALSKVAPPPFLHWNMKLRHYPSRGSATTILGQADLLFRPAIRQ